MALYGRGDGTGVHLDKPDLGPILAIGKEEADAARAS